MKFLLTIPVLLLIGSVNASTFYVDALYYDCDFAGKTAAHSYLNKKIGMTEEKIAEIN